mgnify:CR=1 FL=1
MNPTFSKLLPVVVSSLLSAVSVAQAQSQAPTITPSAAAGEKKAAMCIGCHGIPGYQASFPEVHKVPMIGGQSARYLVSALGAYQKGDRHHPTMKAIAASLTEQDMADLAAFYEKQGSGGAAKSVPAPSAQVASLLEKGKCVTCHGTDYNTAISPEYPKLAGQHADYLYVSLKAYQTANNALVGRANPTMQAQVQGFTHAELKLLANYLGSLQTDLTTHAQPRFR